ncbi:MAG: hypothetical protein CTY12_02020 [Methylotenera sp.]|nr:MAG: hypothetical protein CTY12_02020 [Methylotenera sp.]
MVRQILGLMVLLAQVFIFGFLLVYIVPFFFAVCCIVSFRDSLRGFVGRANMQAAWQDFRNGIWFAVITAVTFVAINNWKVITQWLNQFI